jgi:heme iron utilization protein
MTQTPETPRRADVLRETDDEARALAKTLIRAGSAATLATISPDGEPLATLISTAPDGDGQPVMLVSRLSGHTTYLLANPVCSLLYARAGKGDPLAHPRVSVQARARIVGRESDEGVRVRGRFLRRQPKAELYVDFGDFLFLKAEITGASLNGGFGRAFALQAADLVTPITDAGPLFAAEADILAHMNGDHPDAVSLYATRLAGREPGPWRMVSIDPDGFEATAAGETARVTFGRPVLSPDDAHAALAALAQKARSALA